MAELILGGRKRKFRRSVGGPKGRTAATRPGTGAGGDARSPATRFLLGVVVALALLVGAEGLFHLLLAPRFQITRVVVESDLPVSDEELLRMARISGDELFFSVDTAGIAAGLREYPAVGEATVAKSFPDTLEISIVRRKPVAALIGAEAGLLHVDAEGVAFTPHATATGSDLPIVSGIPEGILPGSRLPEYVETVLASVRRLKMERPELYRMISEYEIVSRGGMGRDVLLYPIPFQTPVRVTPSFTTEECGYIFMVLDTFQRRGILGDIEELDFRSRNVVFRMKEEV